MSGALALPEQAMKRVTLIGLVGGLTLIPAVAAAQDQPWLQDRKFTQGIGIRTGDLELHPGAAAEFGYDSNYLHRDDGENVDEHPIQSLRLRVTPSFMVDTLDRRAADPDGNAQRLAAVTFEFRRASRRRTTSSSRLAAASP